MSKASINKVAFVVDGTTDTGKGIIRLVLFQVATVVVKSGSADPIQDLSRLEEGTPVTFLADLPDYSQVNDFTQVILQELGLIDLVVNA